MNIRDASMLDIGSHDYFMALAEKVVIGPASLWAGDVVSIVFT